MVAGEERRLDAAEDDCAILEEFLALGWKPTHQLQAVAHTESQEFLVGAAHQPHHVQAAVCRDGPAQEREFRAGLAVDVEYAHRSRAHFEDGVIGVVLRHHFVHERPRGHDQAVRARSQRRHAKPHACDVTSVGKPHLFRCDDAAIRFHGYGRPLASRASHGERGLDQRGGPCQHAGRDCHALHGDVVRESLLPHANCVHGHAARPQGEQRGGQVAGPVVRAIRHHDDAGERHASQVLARDVEGTRQVRSAASTRE